jgi:hypothetical protein
MKEFDEEYYEDDEEASYCDCPKCGRSYDEIGYEYQCCRACGWDVEKNKYHKPLKPTKADYMSGEADILTGRWV